MRPKKCAASCACIANEQKANYTRKYATADCLNIINKKHSYHTCIILVSQEKERICFYYELEKKIRMHVVSLWYTDRINHTHRLSGKGIYYSKFNNRRDKHPPQVKILGRKPAYDLPLDLGKYCGKFGDASFYRG